jgi:hypothetical protein
MKGVIAICVAELISNKFGQDKWELILEKTGLDKNTRFLASQDIEDKTIMAVIRNIGEVLHLSLPEIADAFGDYWINEFAPKIYPAFFTGVTSAKILLVKMDTIHNITTKNIPNAHPPRFEYTWKDAKTLIMTYKSHRGLIDIMVGLIKGVGKRYKEDLKVTKISDTQVEIVFPK